MTSSRLLCVGEALIDVVVRPNQAPAEHVGGSVANVAVGCARLGLDTSLAAWWGPDERGVRLQRWATAAGVSVVSGSDQARRTSIAQATVDDQGQASYDFDMEWQLPPMNQVGAFGHLHTGSIAATLEPGGSAVVELVRAHRGTVSYDPNCRPALMGSPELVRARIETLVGLSDVVKASDEDLAWLYPDTSAEQVLRRWLTCGPQLVVVTRGAAGAVAGALGEAELRQVAPGSTPVADTVGAGDSFMAGLLSGLMAEGLLGARQSRAATSGWASVEQVTWDRLLPALTRAVATSAITVSHHGAYAPTVSELS